MAHDLIVLMDYANLNPTLARGVVRVLKVILKILSQLLTKHLFGALR